MPGNQSSYHPSGLRIDFDEDWHTYIDQFGKHYLSGTGFLKPYFPPFDGDAIAARVAAKQNKTPEAVKAEWTWAGESGTRAHENAEYQFKGQPHLMHQPENENEFHAFNVVSQTVDQLLQRFTWYGCELIVFSPRYYIAGTIDLLMHDPARDVWLILDWKKCKAIRNTGFDGEKCYHPIAHLDNCNFLKYSLQLSSYERIARDEGYLPPGAKVERYLIHIAPMATEPVWIPTPDLRAEVTECLLWHAYDQTRKIPGVPY